MRVLINFYLRKSRKRQGGEMPIYVRFTVKSKRADLTTGLFVNPRDWSEARQRVKVKSAGAETINERLDKLRTEIQDLYNQFRSRKEDFTVSSLKDSLLDKEKSEGVIGIFDYYLESILAKLNKGYAMETYKHYKSSRKRLAEFIKARYKRNDYPLDSINYKFLDSFDVYCKQKHGNHQNTAWNYHKHLRRVLNIAVSMDYIPKNPYSKFKVGLKETHREYLTADELSRIEAKEIQIERLSAVRDIFVFACYTGLSFSDITKLNHDHLKTGIDKKTWIIIDRTKTNTRCQIPILPKAKKILEEYKDYPKNQRKGLLLPVLTNQKMNSYLKELGDICGIRKSITMHVARHPFATTVTLGNGVPIETVSKVLGHTSLKTTQIYAKILDKKISEDMDHLKNKLEANNNIIKVNK